MIVIAIDPGVTGAIAALDERGQAAFVEDLPICMQGASKWVDGFLLLTMLCKARAKASGSNTAVRAFVEHIHGTPKMGVTTSHSLGLTLGSIVSVLQVAQIPVELVVPAKWKRQLRLLMPKASDAQKKHASLARARMLFPTAPLERLKDHGRAEALLIAHYAQRYLLGVQISAVAAEAVGELDLRSTSR